MNRLMIIGNLTRTPETRTTQSGKTVCTFSVAVNRRKDEQTDFFRVSAWDKLGENCQRFLDKGSKVAVVGSVSVNAYTTNNGENRASLEVMASEVEFLTKSEAKNATQAASVNNNGYQEVTDEDLPW